MISVNYTSDSTANSDANFTYWCDGGGQKEKITKVKVETKKKETKSKNKA